MSIRTSKNGKSITFTGADARKAFEALTGEKLPASKPVKIEPAANPNKKRIRITNPDHPHTGETGLVTLNPNGTVTVKNIFGAEMLEVELENCPHLTAACFVKKGDIELVP